MARIGDLLVSRGILQPEQLAQALKAQQRLTQQGLEKLLGDLLVAQGFATPGQIREVLEDQQRYMVVCGACRVQFNVEVDDVGRDLTCPKCARTVRVPGVLKEFNVANPTEPTFIDPGSAPVGYLVVKQFDREDDIFALRNGDSLLIGTGPECHVRLNGEEVEPRHGRLRVSGNDILLEDISEDSGMFVNGRRIEKCALQFGDLILFGRSPIMLSPGLPSAASVLGEDMRTREHLLERDASTLVGTTIGRYRFVRLLGVGGMAKVLLAEQTSLNRLVAVKLLNKEMLLNKKAVDRFARESLAGGRLSHPNIVQTYDAGTMGGLLFIAMEYVEGEDVGNLIKRMGQLQLSLALNITLQTARALDFAHENGIIHRDVKPSNIMFCKDRPVKLLDLGIARILDETAPEKRRMGIGTLVYMPPEQTRDAGNVDHRADIYSLGATLFKMLTGRPPFKKKELRATIRSIRKDPMPDPRSVNPEIPEALVRVLERSMEKEPEARYQSMREFQTALFGVWNSID